MTEPEETNYTETGEGSPKSGRRGLRTAAIVLGLLILLAAMGAAIYGLVTNPGITASIRDVAIIALALVTLIIGLFLAVLIFQLQSLIVLLRDEIRPILASVKQTTSTVRGTTTFVSDSVVSPLITVASYGSAIRATVKLLTGGNRRGRSKKSS